jgi:hypothetical protein
MGQGHRVSQLCHLHAHSLTVNDLGSLNLGAGRHIPRQQNVNVGVKVHRSVKVRMEADGLKGGKYWPKANLHVEPQWVD